MLCCNNKPPPNPAAHRYSLFLALAMCPAQVSRGFHRSLSLRNFQEAPSLCNVTISTNGFRKEGMENPKPAVKWFYLEESHITPFRP